LLKTWGISTVVKALVPRQDTLEVPVNLILAKNRHTASIPFLERVSPQGCLWATGQNINLSPFDLGYSPHCRFGKKTPQAGTHYLKLEKRGQ